MDRRDFIKSTLVAAAGTAGTPLLTAQDASAPPAPPSAGAIHVPAREIPVVGETHVAVIGGGIAGVAAAVAAARLGAKVALIEKATLPGGLATLGNVVIYLPICDGYGNQVSGGLCEELLRLSVRNRPDAIPACWREEADIAARSDKRFRVEFNPWDFALDMEELMLKENVSIWYDTRFRDVVRTEKGITHVLLENKSGSVALKVDTVVDASGDADVCARAGTSTVTLDSNVRAGWFFAWDGKRVRRIVLSKTFTQNGAKSPKDPDSFDGTIGEQVTKQLLGTRQMQRERLAKMRQEAPGSEPVNLNTIADFRMTRRLNSSLVLTSDDMGKWHEDTVGLFANWRKKGPVYPVPYRTLYASDVPNLITAGRCISSEGVAWDQSRAIPACAVTGEAAGTAAAMLVRGNLSGYAALPINQLQDTLRRQGALLDPTLAEQARNRASAVDKSADPTAH